MSGLSTGLKNWHWRSKNTFTFCKSWFEEALTGLETSKTKVVKVKDVEGDSDLGMRKSKLVTIYDLKITTQWEGQLSDGTTVSGTLTAVEVSHDMDEDEYAFESALDDPSTHQNNREAQALKDDAQKALADKMRPIFQKYPKAMIEVHGRDLLKEGDEASPATSGTSTPITNKPATPAPAQQAGSSSSSSATTAAAARREQAAASNGVQTGSKVKTEGEFMISAGDLWDLLTNDQKVPSWSRNKATIKPEVGAEVSLFGGNIVGKMLSVHPPNQYTQTWRAPTWPEGHYGKLTVALDQGSASTKLSIELDGVPIGKEEETEKGIEIYYIRSLKQIGSVPPLSSSTTSSSSSSATSTSLRIPRHPWNLPGFNYPGRISYFLTATASMLASVLLPVALIGTFAWLLYRGPTFKK